MAHFKPSLKQTRGFYKSTSLRKRPTHRDAEKDPENYISLTKLATGVTKFKQRSDNIEKSDMADIFKSLCQKKTFFICLTAICLGLLVTAIIVASILNKPTKEESCSVDSELSCNQSSLYRYYGTKTDYYVGRGNVLDEGKERLQEGCEITQLYLLSRHATRYPDGKDIEDMQKILDKIQNRIIMQYQSDGHKLCNNTKDGFETWRLNMVPGDDNRISDSGKKQAKELGERFKSMYPSLFEKRYNENDYKFGYTSRERTKETAVSFAEGIFGTVLDFSSSLENDDILQFHKNCDKKLKDKGYNKTKPVEEEKFIKSKIVESTERTLSERVGFNLTSNQIKVMLRTCQFEFALFGSSIWCSLFSESDVKVYEYLEDINDYYSDGYGGHERNYQQACPLIKDILTNFRYVVQGIHPNAVMMFSHAGAFKKVIAALGLFKDDKPLLSDKYCQAGDRQWRSSHVCPFNANIAFALYKCGKDEFKVETLLNEKPVVVKGCSSSLCSFEEFEAAFKYADDCNLDNVCVLHH